MSTNPLDRIAKLEQRIAEHTDECESLCARLEELGKEHQQVEQVRQQWVATLNAVDDPIFVHDEKLCIIRANTAYAKRAGLPVQDISMVEACTRYLIRNKGLLIWNYGTDKA